MKMGENLGVILELLEKQIEVTTRRTDFPPLYKKLLRTKLEKDIGNLENSEIVYSKENLKIPEIFNIIAEKYESKPNEKPNIIEWTKELKEITNFHQSCQLYNESKPTFVNNIEQTKESNIKNLGLQFNHQRSCISELVNQTY